MYLCALCFPNILFMHTKKLFFLLFMIPYLLVAQIDTSFFPAARKWEIGMNATSVVSNFLGTSTTEVLSPGDYPFFFKKIFNAKSALRVGGGAKISMRKEQQVFGGQDVLRNGENAVNLRIGYEGRSYLSRRFMAYYGIDVVSGFFDKASSSSAGGDIISTRDRGFLLGAGPVYGLQLGLGSRLHIGIEGSFYGYQTIGTKSTTFQVNTGLDTKSDISSFNAYLAVPKWLYVIMKF